MAVDLEQLVQAKVHHRLEELNGTVERLVAEAVDRELDLLVRGLVETELADRTERVHARKQQKRAPAAKTCSSCGETKGARAFERGRRVCRRCRAQQVAQARQRREQEQEQGQQREPEPVPFAGSQSGSSADLTPG